MTERRTIQLVEVGPRDGLQNEPTPFSTAQKSALITGLINAGLSRIEVASFVNPKRVPQMADAEAVIAALPKRDDCTFIGLALNLRGAERAIAAGVDEVGTGVPASETFGIRNQGQTSDEALAEVRAMASRCGEAGMTMQSAVMMAFGCPFEGAISQQRVVDLAKRLADLRIVELGLADTVGVAVPSQVTDLFGLVREAVPHLPLRAHFHDTRNTGIANVWAAVQAGVETIDASIGGLGGCPFAPGASGNVATEDVAYLLDRSGFECAIDLQKLVNLARETVAMLDRPVRGGLAAAGLREGSTRDEA